MGAPKRALRWSVEEAKKREEALVASHYVDQNQGGTARVRYSHGRR